MITVNKETKQIDIEGEDYPIVLLFVDDKEYKIPLIEGKGCLTNLQTEMETVSAYGLMEIKIE